VPGPRFPLLPHEGCNVEIGLAGPLVDEDAFPVDKRLASVGRADDDAVACGLDLELTPRSEVKPLSQWLGHDEPAGRINGSSHAKNDIALHGNAQKHKRGPYVSSQSQRSRKSEIECHDHASLCGRNRNDFFVWNRLQSPLAEVDSVMA